MNETARLDALAGRIEDAFNDIAATRMAGLPFVNPALGVAMRGLQRIGDEQTGEDVGVLITPWFMNVIFLPADQTQGRRVGTKAQRILPAGGFDVVWSHEESLGGYWSLSLFSPMNDFGDMETAIATADEAVAQIFTRPEKADDEELREAVMSPAAGRDVDRRLAETEAAKKAEQEAHARAEEARLAEKKPAADPTPEEAGLNRRSLFGMRSRRANQGVCAPEKVGAR